VGARAFMVWVSKQWLQRGRDQVGSYNSLGQQENEVSSKDSFGARIGEGSEKETARGRIT